jgi:hypothetical protein
MTLLSLVDTYLAICSDAQLPNENQFDSREDAAEGLVQKFNQPEIAEILWDFGISIVVDDQRGPLLNAIVSQVDGYDLLLSQQLAQFGYELACVDWDKVVAYFYQLLIIYFSRNLLESRLLEPLHDCTLHIKSFTVRVQRPRINAMRNHLKL